ncbi:MAG: DUF3108 domain-containing protein [candidate division Zixibacteria bacterium]|nr:DUF3108 domain-containing protein [candidate division Zixibacteria bacterium]
MPLQSNLFRFFVLFLALAGLSPIAYFVAVEVVPVEAASGSNDAIESANSSGFDRYVDNVAFGLGEHLEFDITYGFITAGHATMSVDRLIEFENRPCYKIVTTANSNSFFSTFYNVDDRVESIIDAIGLFSWRFEKNLKEGKYRAIRKFSFDQRNHKAEYNNDTTTVPPYVQDALSVFYYVRTQDLKVGESVFVDHYNDGKLYPMEIKVLKKETITVPAGTFECLVIEPLLQSVGVFKHEGKLKVWLTNDRLRLPVLMKSKVLVGSIVAELTSYKLGEIESF